MSGAPSLPEPGSSFLVLNTPGAPGGISHDDPDPWYQRQESGMVPWARKNRQGEHVGNAGQTHSARSITGPMASRGPAERENATPGGNGAMTAPARGFRHFVIVKTLLLKSKTFAQAVLLTLTV